MANRGERSRAKPGADLTRASRPTPLPTFNMEEYLAICGPDCDFQLGEPMRSLDFRPGVSRWRQPLLAIAGRADGIVTPDLVQEFRKALPAATLVVFEQSGHLPFVEEPERYVQILRDFLANAPAR